MAGRGSCDGPPRQPRLPLCQTPSRTPRRNCRELTADGASAAAEVPSFFNSPNLSPIAAARPRPDGSAAAAAAAADDDGDDDDVALRAAGAPNGGAPGRPGKGEGDLEDGGGGAPLNTEDARRKQRCRGFGHGLSPILSEGRYSASSRGGEGPQAFDSHARDGSVRTSRASGLRVDADDYDDDRRGARRAGASDRGDSPLRPGRPPALRSAGAVRSSGSGPLFTESSVDVTRSSVLRASTTLNTIAPLDDTALSSYGSRTGVSFAGELFADARLRASSGMERAPRYDVFVPLREEQLRRGDGGGGGAVPPPFLRRQEFPQQQQRRSRSAPTLASDWSMHSSSSRSAEVERLAAGMARETASLGPGGVPPAVVGAWLAAAVEGIYSHNACGGGRGGGGGGGVVTDQRVGAKRSQTAGCGVPVPDATAAARAARASFPNACQAIPGRPAYAAGPGDSPPPPPPPPETLVSGEDEEAVNEEEVFYQRQRLLQRVVSAAASHGGVMPSLSSVRDAIMEEEQGREERDAGSSMSKNERSLRRHSDPLSWNTPSVAAAAAAAAGEPEMVEPSAGAAAAAGWAIGGTPAAAAYTRRHTSGYWRDRLGMTH